MKMIQLTLHFSLFFKHQYITRTCTSKKEKCGRVYTKVYSKAKQRRSQFNQGKLMRNGSIKATKTRKNLKHNCCQAVKGKRRDFHVGSVSLQPARSWVSRTWRSLCFRESPVQVNSLSGSTMRLGLSSLANSLPFAKGISLCLIFQDFYSPKLRFSTLLQAPRRQDSVLDLSPVTAPPHIYSQVRPL